MWDVRGFLYRRLADPIIERLLGVHTTGLVSTGKLGFSNADDYLGYHPTGWLTLLLILKPDEVAADDVLVDYGCGRGRILYLGATRYRFARVVGVELSEALSAEAARNLRGFGNVEIVTADATDYTPPDDMTVVYMYNPFGAATFATVVDRILESAARKPRRLRFIYHNPKHATYLLEHGFELTRRLKPSLFRGQVETHLYQLGKTA